MSILVDWQIEWLCTGEPCTGVPAMVVPFDKDLLQPVSLDVRVGATYQKENPATGEMVECHTPSSNSCIRLRPGEFILLSTLEEFNMPSNVYGDFRLRSTFARQGLDQAMAVHLEPGWHGSVLTLELRNNRRFGKGIELHYGERIGQVLFHQLQFTPDRNYAEIGHYNNDKTVQGAKIT